MKRGYIKLWRKSKDSTIFAHEGLWKIWCLCLMKANHEGAEVMVPGLLKAIKLNPGQFITGRYSLHYDYHQGHLKKKYRRKASPTPYSLIRWLLILKEMEMLSIETFNKYSIVTILNWHLYQEKSSKTLDTTELCPSLTDKQAISANSEHQKMAKNDDISDGSCDDVFKNDHHVSIRRASSEHKQELKEELKEETPAFFSLKNRYPDQDLIDKVFQAIASTRKSEKVADSVLLAQLQKWDRYPVDQVENGIRIYLEKDCAGQGKREPYLLGIIRNQQVTQKRPDSSPPKKQPSIKELMSND